MTERKPKKAGPTVPTRTPGKREAGIFANLRKPSSLHPVEEILQLPPATTPAQTVGESPTVEPSTPGKSPTLGVSTGVNSTPVETPILRSSEGSTVGTPRVGEMRPIGESPTVRISVAFKEGDLRIPNFIVFGLYPMLDLDERAVYQELYLWTWGFGQNERRLSQARLCKSLRTTDKTLARILRSLVQKGLVDVGDTVSGGPRDARGTVFRVHLPATHGDEERDRTGRKSPRVGESPRVGDSPNMKKKRHEEKTVDLYEVRTIAARLFEAHRDELGFDQERLRALVHEALIGQGIQADGETIEEAIRGMAV